MPSKRDPHSVEMPMVSTGGRFTNPASGRPPLHASGGRAAAAKALAAVAAVTATATLVPNKGAVSRKGRKGDGFVSVKKLEDGDDDDDDDDDEDMNSEDLEIRDSNRRSSRTILAVAVGLTLLTILLVLQHVNDASSSKKSTSSGGSSSNSASAALKSKQRAMASEAIEAATISGTSAAPTPAMPPAAIASDGSVWSKGSWMRFAVEPSGDGTTTDATVGVPAGCVAYPSVSSLAVTCDLALLPASKFPLQFEVEVLPGIVTKDVKCATGCNKVTTAASKQAGRLSLTVSSYDDLTERCLEKKNECLLSFDFLVTYTSADAAPHTLPPVCFLSVGDWGSAEGLTKVAQQMTKEAKNSFSKFIVSTGDNFYPTGVKSLNDPHWENTFERPFGSPYVKNVRWVIAAGNHDQWGLQPQLQYGIAHPRWYFPSPFYNDEIPLFESEHLNGPSASTSIFMTVLDFNGRQKEKQVAFLNTMLGDRYVEVGGVPAGNNNNAFASENANSVKKFLWRGIVNHPLLFGGSSHGLDRETTYNRDQLKPSMDKHKVHFHLSGHDHILEVLHSNHTDYFISGAGGGSWMYTSTKTKETVWWQGEGVRLRGFMKHCVFGHDRMETALISDDGTVLYTHWTPFDN